MKKNKMLFTGLLLLLFVTYSCENEELQPENTPFSSEILKKVNPVFLEHDLSAYKINPIWDSFITFDNKNAVEVNFTIDDKIIMPMSKNEKILGRKRLLLTLKNGKISETIIEYIPSDNFKGKMKDINSKNYKSKQFDGKIIFQNIKNPTKIMLQLTNGKIITKSSNKSLKNKKGSTTNRWVETTYETCVPYYYVISAGNSNEGVLKFSHWDCETYTTMYWVEDGPDETPTLEPEEPPMPDPTPDPTDPPLEDECIDLENEFDSSFGQSISEDISSTTTSEDNYSRTVTYTWSFYEGYGMKLYSVDKGIHNRVGDNWEWQSLQHLYVYQETSNSLFEVTYTINNADAIVNSSNTARVIINYNVKSILNCGGIALKTKEENYTSYSVKSPRADSDQ